jgi:hypothetical protein
VYTVCDQGVHITGAYILAPGQTVQGGPARNVFDGFLVVSADGCSVRDLNITTGGVQVTGTSCRRTTVQGVHTRLGVSVYPAGRGLIDIESSVFADITADAPRARYPLGIAHATGFVDLTCPAGASVVLQPADNTVGFSAPTTKCADPPALNLNAIFGVFGTDLERVEFYATPDPASQFLRTYWHTALAVTLVGVFINYVGRPAE